MTSPPLRVERAGPLARVVLTRPDVHNAFDDTVIAALHQAAREIGADDSVRVVLLASEGPSFSAGADLRWMRRMAAAGEEENRADALAMAEMFGAWDRLPRPVVGRIQGAALGGGVGLVCVTDIAVAAQNAVFGFTEIRLGILPAVISPFATARIGRAAARELFLTGERFPAERGREIGLVHRVVAPQELDAEVNRVVDALLAGGPQAQARAKRLLQDIDGKTPEEVRGYTAQTIAQARGGAEGQEGIRAFLEKREPSWRGKR